MSVVKCLSTFSRQMEAIVYINLGGEWHYASEVSCPKPPQRPRPDLERPGEGQ